jgi:colicin import membrane protein
LPGIKRKMNMKRLLIALLTLLPLTAIAQYNTWERIETGPVEKENPDAKYLVPNAVPEIDGKVCWEMSFQAPSKSAKQIYDILLTQLTKMTEESNQIENSIVAVKDSVKYELGAVFHEWLVFKSVALSLDRTQFNYQILVFCEDGKADVKLTRITYDYDLERNPTHYQAEKWITDKYCVNKKHTKLYPISGKFRRKTIDRKDFIFNKFNTLLNEK